MLTQERLKELLDYNPETGVFVWKLKPANRIHIGSVAGRAKTESNGKNYRCITISGKGYLAHRLAWFYVRGELPKDQIDHIDGNGLNNAIINLREVSHQDNSKNRRKPSNNTSSVVGVVWHGRSKKWQAQISLEGKQKYLGSFTDKSEAIKIRKEAEKKYGFHPNHGSERPL